MRHLIVLPGNSVKNKAWGELILEHYAPHFDSAFMLAYDHWTTGEGNIDFDHEEEKLRIRVSQLPVDTEVVVLAKSAGSLLTFRAVHHGVLTPTRCVFFGIPFDWASRDVWKGDWAYVESFTVPAIAFHNREDPTASYDFTKTTLETAAPHISLITTNATDHWYGDVATYDSVIHYQ